MQVRQETKWKRDQQGRWSKVEVTKAPQGVTIGTQPIPKMIPGVTYRVRTGRAITGMSARSSIVALAGGSTISIHRGPESRVVQLSVGAKVNGITLGQGAVFATLQDGHICQIDSTTRKVIVTSPDLGSIPVGHPVATSDGWLANMENGSVVALSAALSPKWRFVPPAGTLGFQPATSVGRGVYVPGESTLYRLDGASGLVNWSADLGERGCITPAVTAGLVVSAATGGGITCLDAASGKRRWLISPDVTGSSSWTGVSAAGLKIVVASQQGDVVCINRETGQLDWVRGGLGRVMFPPIGDVRHGCAVVFVQDTDAGIPAEILGLDLHSGRTMWRARVGNLDVAPVLTGDRLWITSATGTLYAFDYG